MNCKMAAAGAPPPSLSDDDDLDYGTLPPKSLERLFGVDIVVANPDEPGDGIFHVIRDRKGKTLYLRNPKTNRWLRALGPTAQRLVDEAQNAVVAPKRKREQEDVGEASATTLLPVRKHKKEEEWSRKREQEDVGEACATTLLPVRKHKKEEEPPPVAPTLLPVRIRKRKIDEEQEDVGEASARIVSARKREEEHPLPVKNRVARKKDARKRWKVAVESVRFSLRLHKQKQSASTGLSLDFDSMDI